MKLCITEKPSVAHDVAVVLGANTKRDGYYEGNGYRVTWVYGHLCTLKEPHDYTYDWKRWTIDSLPMIPAKFGVKLIEIDNYKKQFSIIERLANEAEEIINCGDAGQEGELIQRWVMQMAAVKCPVRRLWISSLTDEAIREGFKNLRPQHEYDNLYYAGLSRAVGDWILGINATRLYTLKYGGGGGNVLSIGRVQTPTLALIVQRQQEIANFVPKDSFELRTVYRETIFTSTLERFANEREAQLVAQRIAANQFVVDEIATKRGTEAAPRLFDLTSLQVECNKRWGWSAEEALKVTQSLYEKKVTTYPRVDTTYLSDDIYNNVPSILQGMKMYSQYTEPLLRDKLPKSKKVFDSSKVTDHHAIIPTGQHPSGLTPDESKLYDLIAMRFISVFYPDCEFLTTTVTGHAADVKFKVNGKVIDKPGWRVLFKNEQEEKDENAENDTDGRFLPQFVKGENGPHLPNVAKRTSQPPKLYTEGTLLRAMETAGKNVDDEELRDAMKENGIGRPSTRAAIIETLFKRKYISRQKKNIVATEAGISLIQAINEPLLKSAKLTGMWENKLRRIERGEYKAADFVAELKQLIHQIVTEVKADSSARSIQTGQVAPRVPISQKPKKASVSKTKPASPKKSVAPAITQYYQIPCPKCKVGHIRQGVTAFGCSNYGSTCDFVIKSYEAPANLTPAQLASLLASKKRLF